jgi:hypothetical protein
MMESAKSKFPARMKGTRFPDRSDRWPIGMRKRALAAAWRVKISPVWAMGDPRLAGVRERKRKGPRIGGKNVAVSRPGRRSSS